MDWAEGFGGKLTSQRDDMTRPPRAIEVLTIRRHVPLKVWYEINAIVIRRHLQWGRRMEENIHRLRNADSIHTLDEPEDDERSATATVNPFVNQMLFRYNQE